MAASGTYCGEVARIGVKRTTLDRNVTCPDCRAKKAALQERAQARAAGRAEKAGPPALWECKRCERKFFGPASPGGMTPDPCLRCGERSWRRAKYQAQDRRP